MRPATLETVADAVEWAAWHLVGRSRKDRYQYRPDVMDSCGRARSVLAHSVRETGWHRRSSKRLYEQWTRLGRSLKEVLERRWPVSDASGGRIPQTAMGVLRLVGTDDDVTGAERRAAELVRGWEEADARERRLEREAEHVLGDDARDWIDALSQEFGVGYGARSAARECEAGLEAALVRLARLAPGAAARKEA